MYVRDGRTKPKGRIESSRNFIKTPHVQSVRVHRILSVHLSGVRSHKELWEGNGNSHSHNSDTVMGTEREPGIILWKKICQRQLAKLNLRIAIESVKEGVAYIVCHEYIDTCTYLFPVHLDITLLVLSDADYGTEC